MTFALWWAGCSLSAPAPEVDAHGPGITELSHRALPGRAGRQLPSEVSATFVADGLQVYVTGLQAPCDAPPYLALEVREADLWLRERRAAGVAEHCGHTLLLQLDGVSAGSHTVRVLRADGMVFGEAQVTAETH